MRTVAPNWAFRLLLALFVVVGFLDFLVTFLIEGFVNLVPSSVFLGFAGLAFSVDLAVQRLDHLIAGKRDFNSKSRLPISLAFIYLFLGGISILVYSFSKDLGFNTTGAILMGFGLLMFIVELSAQRLERAIKPQYFSVRELQKF